MRNLRRTTVAFALLAAGGAQAQDTAEGGADTLELSTLTVEADGVTELFGQTFAESAGSVMKTDTPIFDTPRSVSVVTQQQMQDRGARTVVQALQYTPGVLAGAYGLDNRGIGRWCVALIRPRISTECRRSSAITTTPSPKPSCSTASRC